MSNGRGKECIDHLGRKFSSEAAMCKFWGVEYGYYDYHSKKGDNLKDILENGTGWGVEKPKNVVTDHLGNEFSSEREMCEHWKVSQSTYHRHVKNGWSIEDALTFKADSTEVVDHLGNSYKSKSELCRHYNISWNTIYNRSKQGMSVEEALLDILDKNPVVDHLGNEYDSKAALCRHYKISYKALNNRLKQGMNTADAMRDILEEHCVIEYLGNKYTSKAELCRCYNINYTTFSNRLKQGMSVEDAVKSLLEGHYVLDHFGNKYKDVEEMCKHYNVRPSTYYSRKKIGYDVDLSLVLDGGPIADHEGEPYKSIKEMCKHYDVPVHIYKMRRRLGWSNKEALLSDEGLVIDHLGHRYSTLENMCKHYRMATETYNYRVNELGYTVEQALTTKPLPKKRVDDVDVVKDHKGNIYSNLREMCANYDISISTYSTRQLDKWTLEDTLETPEGLKEPLSEPRGTVRRGDGSKVYDHKGKVYNSLALMCNSYNTPINVFFSRLAHGWSLKSALESDGDILKDTDVAYDFNGTVYESMIEMCKDYGISVEAYQRKINSYWDMEKALTGKKNK